MKNEKEKWISDVLNSAKGKKGIKPNPNLFDRIEQQIDSAAIKIIPITQWRIAAAILLLVFNVYAMYHHTQHQLPESNTISLEENIEQSIISNYKIYD